jgi:hypothetical protein
MMALRAESTDSAGERSYPRRVDGEASDRGLYAQRFWVKRYIRPREKTGSARVERRWKLDAQRFGEWQSRAIDTVFAHDERLAEDADDERHGSGAELVTDAEDKLRFDGLQRTEALSERAGHRVADARREARATRAPVRRA